jgi:hypothetical protein
VLLLDKDGKERVRLEGYLPNNDFLAALKSGFTSIGEVKPCGHGLRELRVAISESSLNSVTNPTSPMLETIQ